MEIVRVPFFIKDDPVEHVMLVANSELQKSWALCPSQPLSINIVFKANLDMLPNVGFVTTTTEDIASLHTDTIANSYCPFIVPNDHIQYFSMIQPRAGDRLAFELDWLNHYVIARLKFTSGGATNTTGNWTPWQLSNSPENMRLSVLTELENVTIMDSLAFDVYSLTGKMDRPTLGCGICFDQNHNYAGRRICVYECGHFMCRSCEKKMREAAVDNGGKFSDALKCPVCSQTLVGAVEAKVRDSPCPIDACIETDEKWLLPCGCVLYHAEKLDLEVCPYTLCGATLNPDNMRKIY